MKSYSVPDGKEDGVLSKGLLLLLIFLGLLGIFMIVGAAVMYGKVFPDLYRSKVDQALIIKNGSEAGERFIKSPVANYLKFYVFNVTNSDDVNGKGAKPFLQELGPYVFRRDRVKEILRWNEVQGSVTYRTKLTYFFEKHLSTGKLDDVVNHVNALGLGLVSAFESQSTLTTLLGVTVDELVEAIRGQLVVNHTVNQLLFEGFSMQEYFPEDYEHLCRLKDNCLFGFYYGRNHSYEKEYEVSTGEKDISSLGKILRYDKETKLPFHHSDSCNSINGTEGFLIAPGIKKEDHFYVFSADVCRSFEFSYSRPEMVEGIPAMRFVIPDHVFENPNIRRENMCFCQTDNQTLPCIFKSGVINLSVCKNGSPVIASQPHFLMGEKEYLDDVRGLKPDQQLHQGFLDIEPVTGAVIRGSKKLQINMVVNPDSRVKFLAHQKKRFYFPVFWVEEAGEIDAPNAAIFRSRVLTPYLVGKWTLVAALILGVLLLLLSLVTCTLKRRKKEEKD